MKKISGRVLSILILLLPLAGGCISAAQAGGPVIPKAGDLDAVYRQQIVGTWVEGEEIVEVAKYGKNGKYQGWVYDTPKRENLIARMTGTWSIKDGQLWNVLTKSTPPVAKDLGNRPIGKIISLTDKLLTLEDETGQRFSKIREVAGN